MGRLFWIVACAAAFGGAGVPRAYAFEDTRVMPRGVRRLSLRMVTSDIKAKTSPSGDRMELSKPLNKDLKFKDVVKSEDNPTKRNLTKGFLGYADYDANQSVGAFDGKVRTRVSVFAPILTYGLTDVVTVAAAMPIFNMATSVGLGFKGNATGQDFVDTLANGYNNQRTSAVDASEKFANAVQRLNDKLDRNGYRRLENWQETGPGDLTVLAKWRSFESTYFQSAIQGGVVAPTGRVDDPDNLIDKGFGDGQWDIFQTVGFDQPIGETGLLVNEFVRYTWQLPGERTVRLQTEEETIEVEKTNARFKLGDKIDAGTSLQYGSDIGLTSGVGYNFFHKGEDFYDVDAAARDKLERDTLEQSHQLEVEIGYSAVPAYRRKQVPVPFETKFNYKYQLASRNMPITHLFQLDAGVFF